MEKIIQNLPFTYVNEIIPDLDSNNQPLEFFPQNKYENKLNHSLHRYGKGPFCKFNIEKKYAKKSGVYCFEILEKIFYIGECEDFYKRINYGYGNISPRNCFEGGQPTNCRINTIIFLNYKEGEKINLYFHETNDRYRIEHDLITNIHPEWNRTIGKPSLQ